MYTEGWDSRIKWETDHTCKIPSSNQEVFLHCSCHVVACKNPHLAQLCYRKRMGKNIHEQHQEIVAEMVESGHVQSSAPHLFVNSDIYNVNCTFKVRHKSDSNVANSHGVQCVGALVTAATITISVEEPTSIQR
ncbi:hypothetical protein J4Q44_G00132410 [Coregonus suidteri]|uniref:Uncharacterized protein n=1 Tax=Coregonus suidteri TaxID=861788 RepID=A0AAN8LXQ3_9TELE